MFIAQNYVTLYPSNIIKLHILLQVQYPEFVIMMSRPGDEPMERKASEIWDSMLSRLEGTRWEEVLEIQRRISTT